jgi:uncharacterized phage-associated protein
MLNLRKFNTFNIEKIIQVLAYIQRKLDCTDKLKLIKLLFFSDRIHLRNYLSFISFDIYYALRNGPAASKSLNVVNKYEDFIDKENLKLLEKIDILDKNNRIIKEKDTGYMSKVEMSVLDEACELFGNFSTSILIDITHDYPEWKRYKDLFEAGSNDGELIVIDDFFENIDVSNSPAILKYFNGIDPLYIAEDTLSDAKDIYLSNERLKSAYR